MPLVTAAIDCVREFALLWVDRRRQKSCAAGRKIPEFRAQVLQPRVAYQHHNDLAGMRSAQKLQRSREVCAGRETSENTLFGGKPTSTGKGIHVTHLDVAIDCHTAKERKIAHPVASALNPMIGFGHGFSRQRRGAHRFHHIAADGGIRGTEGFGANKIAEYIDLARLLKDLRSSCVGVCVPIAIANKLISSKGAAFPTTASMCQSGNVTDHSNRKERPSHFPLLTDCR
jgi:hypothetical protein